MTAEAPEEEKPARKRREPKLPPQDPPNPPTELRWSIQAEQAAETAYQVGREANWDLAEELQRASQYRRDQDAALASWWVYCKEFEIASRQAARADVDYDRILGRIVFMLRAQGERSAEVATQTAHAYNDEVFNAKLARDLARARVAAADKHMRRLDAYLDDLRTQEANKRAMDQHANWTGGQA